MICSNCNKELNENNRCCLFCGAINPYHPANQALMQNINYNNQQNNQVETLSFEESSNTISKTSSGGINILFGIVNILFAILAFFLIKNYIAALIVTLYVVSFEMILMKANLPWWGMFIPIVNLYLLSKVAFSTNFFFYILLIYIALLFGFPLLIKAGSITAAVFVYKILKLLTYTIIILPVIFLIALGNKFGVKWYIIIFFGFFIIPDIAFSRRYQYNA